MTGWKPTVGGKALYGSVDIVDVLAYDPVTGNYWLRDEDGDNYSDSARHLRPVKRTNEEIAEAVVREWTGGPVNFRDVKCPESRAALRRLILAALEEAQS